MTQRPAAAARPPFSLAPDLADLVAERLAAGDTWASVAGALNAAQGFAGPLWTAAAVKAVAAVLGFAPPARRAARAKTALSNPSPNALDANAAAPVGAGVDSPLESTLEPSTPTAPCFAPKPPPAARTRAPSVARKRHANAWPPAALAALKAAIDAGQSARLCAAAVQAAGFDYSRSAVIGQARRSGWRLTGQERAVRSFKGRPNAPRLNTAKTNGGGQKLPAVGPSLSPVDAPPPPPSPSDVARVARLELLERGACRWPVGDPGAAGFGFCGAPVAAVANPGAASPTCPHYCADHTARALSGRPLRPLAALRCPRTAPTRKAKPQAGQLDAAALRRWTS